MDCRPLRLLLHDVVAKDESDFSHGPGLVFVEARGTEAGARRVVAGMNPGKVSADEEASVLKCGCQSNRRARTAWTEYQVDRVLFIASRAGDIFPAHREREPVFEGAT